MSKYWIKMEIWNSSKKYNKATEELFISLDKPSFFVNRGYYESQNSLKRALSTQEIEYLAELYKYNYRIGKSNNTIFVSNKNINDFINLNSLILTVYQKNELIGSMISILIPLSIATHTNIKDNSETFEYIKKEKKDFVFGCSSYLILTKKNRGKGLGMAAIQESLQILYENGGLGAYFINTVSRCVNSIPLFVWYYPLNIEKLDACHFNYNKEYKNLFISHIHDETNNRVSLVDKSNIQISYEFLISSQKDKKFCFSPSLKYWEKWTNVFPTFIVEEKNKIIGLFVFNNHEIWYPTNRTLINTGYLIFSIGEILKEAIIQSKKYYDILMIYEIGDINLQQLNQIFAQRSHKSYINFFNTTISLLNHEFYAPLF